MRSLSIAATGMLAQQTNVDVISNNIANMNTTAFKRQRAEFQDLLYQQVARPGAASGGNEAKIPAGIQIGAGVRTGGVYRIAEQGALTQTSNRFDVAIQGQGYFQITLASGETGYTRDGSFQLSCVVAAICSWIALSARVLESDQAAQAHELPSTAKGMKGRPGRSARPISSTADMPNALGKRPSCSPSASPARPFIPPFDTSRPAAVETIRAGIWLTRPSPTVRMV